MLKMYEDELERLEKSEDTSNLLHSLQHFMASKKKILAENHYIFLQAGILTNYYYYQISSISFMVNSIIRFFHLGFRIKKL